MMELWTRAALIVGLTMVIIGVVMIVRSRYRQGQVLPRIISPRGPQGPFGFEAAIVVLIAGGLVTGIGIALATG